MDDVTREALSKAAMEGREGMLLSGLHVVRYGRVRLVAGPIRNLMRNVVPERLRDGQRVTLSGQRFGVELVLGEERSSDLVSDALERLHLLDRDLDLLATWQEGHGIFHAAPFYFLDEDGRSSLAVDEELAPGGVRQLHTIGFSVVAGFELCMVVPPGVASVDEAFLLALGRQLLDAGPVASGRTVVPGAPFRGITFELVDATHDTDTVRVYQLVPRRG